MGVQCGTLRGVGSLAYRTLEGGEESPILNTAHLLIAHWSELEGGGEESLHTTHCTTSEAVPLILNVTALDWTAWTAQAKETAMLLFQHCIARQRLHCFSIHWASSL